MSIYSDAHILDVPADGVSMGFHSGEPDTGEGDSRFLVLEVNDGARGVHRLCVSTSSPGEAAAILRGIARMATSLVYLLENGQRDGRERDDRSVSPIKRSCTGCGDAERTNQDGLCAACAKNGAAR